MNMRQPDSAVLLIDLLVVRLPGVQSFPCVLHTLASGVRVCNMHEQLQPIQPLERMQSLLAPEWVHALI
jgi:hypothetical protein